LDFGLLLLPSVIISVASRSAAGSALGGMTAREWQADWLKDCDWHRFQHSSSNSRSWPASSGWTWCASKYGRWYAITCTSARTGESSLKRYFSITRYGPGASRRSLFSSRWRWISVLQYPWPTSSPLSVAIAAGSSVSLDLFTETLQITPKELHKYMYSFLFS